MFRGYKLFKVQQRYSLNLLPISAQRRQRGVGGVVEGSAVKCLAAWRPAPEEEPRGAAGGELAAPPQHLLQANGCYNLINVMKLDIIP